MGAEDFSFWVETIPSAFSSRAGKWVDPPTNYGLHHPHFALDESVMPRGVELHVNLALRRCANCNKENQWQLPSLPLALADYL
jgi:metal-dependent amidase/aminoacylase/carboxypeptidase family protein